MGQGRFTVDTQTGHARLGTPLRLAVKLFEAKSATCQAAAFPVPSARRRDEQLPNAIRHGHVYALLKKLVFSNMYIQILRCNVVKR